MKPIYKRLSLISLLASFLIGIPAMANRPSVLQTDKKQIGLNTNIHFLKQELTPTVKTAKARNCASPEKPSVDNIYLKKLQLSWNSPEELYGYYDSFEEHQDFSVNSAGSLAWTYYDLDNLPTFGLSEYIYPSRESKMAFMIFNPEKTSPPVSNPFAFARSGEKYLACFSAFEGVNNDWLISPALHFDEEFYLSFYASSYSTMYNLERIKIAYSSTDNNPSSFKFVQTGDYIEVPGRKSHDQEWTAYSFKFPAETKYVGIVCVSDDAYMLMIDDISIATNKVRPIKSIPKDYIVGFNVYRNDTKINSAPINSLHYTDQVPDYGTYTYKISAVYQSGCESPLSDALDIDVPSIHKIPFIDNFDEWSLETNFWTLEPDSNYWFIDYMVGGLADPMASLRLPGIYGVYDNLCLVSKELDAKNIDTILLRYDIAHEYFTLETAEMIALDVWNGSVWKTVKTHLNSQTPDKLQRFQYDISEHAAGKMFRFRFRAKGNNGFNAIQWYIDNIKVWEKSRSILSGSITDVNGLLSGIKINIVSQSGDILSAQTDKQGKYHLLLNDTEKIFIEINSPEHILYQDTLVLLPGLNELNIRLQKPISEFRRTKELTYFLKSEESVTETLHLHNVGEGNLKYSVSTQITSSLKLKPQLKNLKTFYTSNLLQSSIVFDGEYFYTGVNNYIFDRYLYKYNKNGQFIESFQISGVRLMYDMTYDGRYMYATTGQAGTGEILVIDMDNKRLVNTIQTPFSNSIHIAYDAQKDAFWCGDWANLCLLNKKGELLSNVVSLNIEIAGSAYDPYNENGPSLWLSDQGAVPGLSNILDRASLVRFDITTMKVTDERIDLSALPGFSHGTSGRPTYGTGISSTSTLIPNTFCIIGSILQDPGLIYVQKLYDLPKAISITPVKGDIDESSSENYQLVADAAQMLKGDTIKAHLIWKYKPEIPSDTLLFTLIANEKATYPRPTDLKGLIVNDQAVVLSWNKPIDAQPKSYIIYCNGDSLAITEGTNFTHTHLKYGHYQYHVKALYEGNYLSRATESIEQEIITGISCLEPFDVKANNLANRSIVIEWKNPHEITAKPATLRWDAGVNDDSFGTTEGESFRVAQAWSAKELQKYQGMRLSAIEFFPTGAADFHVCVFSDKKLIYRQKVKKVDIGQFNKVHLDTTFYIDGLHEIMVGYDADDKVGTLPIGVDAGPAIDGKGNLIYFDDTGWTTILKLSGKNFNLNIAMELQPKDSKSTISSDMKAEDNPTVKSYDIYRDGNKVNKEAVHQTRYEDSPLKPGLYTYQIKAVYDNCTSYPSQSVQAEIYLIENHDAPENLQAQVELNRDILLWWDYPNNSVSITAGKAPFSFMREISLQKSGEQAIVFDGKYIYTAAWNEQGLFNKYQISGEFVESFQIDHVGGVRNLCFDGKYFYAACNEPVIYQLDFEKKQKVAEFDVTDLVRHIAYIPDLDNGKGGFEIGSWNSSWYVSKTGATLGKGPVIDQAFSSVYHNGKLYYFMQSGLSACQIHEYDFSSNLPSGNYVDLAKIHQIQLADKETAGGLSFITYDNGSTALIANIQSSKRNRLVFLEIEEARSVIGFHVYKNGTKLNTELVERREYSDYEDKEGSYLYHIQTVYADLEVSPKSEGVEVKIIASDVCPKPIDVKAIEGKRDVNITWRAAEDSTNKQIETVEGYPNFSLTEMGAWSTIDIDKANTFSPFDAQYTNKGKPMAFMVFNPSATNPPMLNTAYSGKKVFACFGANASRSLDLLISPQQSASENYILSFMAKGLHPDKAEQFYIAISKTGKEVNDFILLDNKSYSVSTQWNAYRVEIPKEVKYVGIYYASVEGFGMFVDDLYIGSPRKEGVYAHSYDIYKNGNKLNTKPLTSLSYKDQGLKDGEHCYQVQVKYNNSCVSPKSDHACVVVNYPRPCLAPKNFTASLSNKKVLLNWEKPPFDKDITLSWSKGSTGDSYGVPDGGNFFIAAAWDLFDLSSLHNYTIKSVSIGLQEPCAYLKLFILQDGVLVYEQESDNFDSRDMTKINLNTPYMIDNTKELKIGFEIENEEEQYPVYVDEGPGILNKGDLYSTDGKSWLPLKYALGKDANWMISAEMEITSENAYKNAPKSNLQTGYNVYRNEIKLNASPIINSLQYLDEKPVNGKNIYKVSAIYQLCGEAFSSRLSINYVDLEKELKTPSIKIHPNPFDKYFKVEGCFEKIEVLDTYGRLILTENKGKQLISTDLLGSGLYLVRIYSKQGVEEFKVIKK